jgi:hypothetical protein
LLERQENGFVCWAFSYVCPEPVLAKRKMARKKAFFTHVDNPSRRVARGKHLQKLI